MHRLYTILVERPSAPDESFGVTCPDVPGCFAVGDTEAEAVALMTEALAFHLRELAADGDPIPESTLRAAEVAVAMPESLAEAA